MMKGISILTSVVRPSVGLALISGLISCANIHVGYFEANIPLPWSTTPLSLVADVGQHNETEEVDGTETE